MGAGFSKGDISKTVGICGGDRYSLIQFKLKGDIQFEGSGIIVEMFRCIREPLGKYGVLYVVCMIDADPMWGLDEAYI